MKLRLDATPGELRDRGADLLERLGKALEPHAPELADVLAKAASLPKEEPALKHKALRELHGGMRARYQRQLDRMTQEVANLLEGELSKAAGVPDSPDYTQKIVDIEQAAFDKVKTALYELGHVPEDFEAGGVLYGMSTNELRELVQTKRAAT